MEIIVETLKETMFIFSWKEVIGSIVLTIFCFGFIEFVARMKYKEYLQKQSSEVKGIHLDYKIVKQEDFDNKILTEYRDEVTKSVIKILVLSLLLLVNIVVLIILLVNF